MLRSLYFSEINGIEVIRRRGMRCTVHAAYTILIASTPCCLNTTEYFVLVIVLRIILKFKIVVVKQRYFGKPKGIWVGGCNIKASLKAMLYDCVVWLRVGAGGRALRTRQ